MIGRFSTCIEPHSQISVSVNGRNVLEDKMAALRDVWEELSFQLERRQTNPHCVGQEEMGLKDRKAPPYSLTFDPDVMEEVTDSISNGIGVF